MKLKFILLPMLAALLVLSSCISPVTIRPEFTPLEIAVVPVESSLPTATPLPLRPEPRDVEPTGAAAEQLDTLTYWMGHWRSMGLTATPAEDPVLQSVIDLLLQTADVLSIPLSREELVGVQPYDEAEALVRRVAAAVGRRYGADAQTLFEIRYATGVADLLLWFVDETMSAEEVQSRSHTAANYLTAAMSSAQQAGLQGELLTEGLQLSYRMERGAEPLEASRNVFMWRIRVLSWLGNREQLAAAEATPDPSAPAVAVSEETAGPDPEQLFFAMGCIDCHYLQDPADGIALNNLIAPSLAHLHENAGVRVQGQDAASYIYTSIVDPNAYVVEGYDADLMPLSYDEEMDEAEIRALVDWLLAPQS